jgi:hypothetical protein
VFLKRLSACPSGLRVRVPGGVFFAQDTRWVWPRRSLPIRPISWIRATFREAAVALAAVVLREPVSAAQLAGVACVLGTVLLATFGQLRTVRGTA